MVCRESGNKLNRLEYIYISSPIHRIVEDTFYGPFPIPESVRLNVTTLPRGWRLMIVWSWTVMLQKSNYTPRWFTPQRRLHISFPSLCKVLQLIHRNVWMSHFRHSWESTFGWGVLCWRLQCSGLVCPTPWSSNAEWRVAQRIVKSWDRWWCWW